MKEYHGARIAGREELDGLDFPSEVQLAIDDLAESCARGRAFSHFASEDLLQEQTVERVLAGLSSRRYRAASSPPPPLTARCRARRCRGTSWSASGRRSTAYAWDWAENVGAIDATFSVGRLAGQTGEAEAPSARVPQPPTPGARPDDTG